jgi:hypothetical protein
VHQQTVGNECNRCHTTESWLVRDTKSMHLRKGFNLSGSHASADCNQCHTANNRLRFENLRTDCYACHKTQYESAPNHKNKYSHNCEECHNISAPEWRSSGFNHSFFPLTQGHANRECAQCHGTPHQKVSPDCYGCHKSNFEATTSPNHVVGKFSTNCTLCHSTKPGWRPATFDHSKTAFPLKGSHAQLECIQCHANGYAGTPTSCVSCHQKDYNATTNPSHVTAKFSTDCKLCHTESTWIPSSFNHNTATAFPLKGSHVSVSCSKCQTSGYKGTPTACSGCHMANYNATKNPAHAAAKFPTTCESCHTENAWIPSTFNHTQYFPINTGRHNVACSICHTNPANYASFTCMTASCHPKSSTDSDHRGVGGYSYNSSSCYRCHPTGKD